MLKKIIPLLISLLIISAIAHSQELYKDKIYSDVKKSTKTFYQKSSESLRMDIFSPSADTLTKKPVLLYVHGGGFSGGSRDEERHLQFCRHFALKGYMGVTMDYTLQRKGKSFGCDCPADEKVDTFLETARDISRAVRYLTDNHSKLGIDTNRIVLAGSSAGAEAVLHAAYWDETRSDDSTHILSGSFKYGGVISMAGALTELRWVDHKTAIPTQLFHGSCDHLVPYGTASHHYCDVDAPGYLTLYGSATIMNKLKTMGKGYYAITGCFGRHEWNELPLYDYVENVTDFLFNDVVKNKKRQIHYVVKTGKDPCPSLNRFPFCEEFE